MSQQIAPQNKKDVTKTQEEILAAAIHCVKRWGLDRVTLNDIAYEARVARSTVYSYYKNREEVIRAALLFSAYTFAEKLFEHISQFKTPEERTIEAVVFSLKTLPDEPSLALLSESSLSELVREHSLTTSEGLDIGTAVLKVILGDLPYSDKELQEMSEWVIRFLLSLVTLDSPIIRHDDELRGYLARRLLPSLGLKIPKKFDNFNRET